MLFGLFVWERLPLGFLNYRNHYLVLPAVELHPIIVCKTNDPVWSFRFTWITEEHHGLRWQCGLWAFFHLWTQLCTASSDLFPFLCYDCYYLGTGDMSQGLTTCSGTAGGPTGYEAEVLSVRADPRASAVRSAVQIPGVVPCSRARLV